MAVTNGGELREWRRSRGWDVPDLARRLRRAADEPIAAHEGLVRMIRAWERGDHRPSERAVTTAQNHAARLDRETGITTPESQSVYGSVLLRGALVAAQHDDRATAHEMLAEAADTARRLGTDANLRGTAFGPVNTQMHQVNVAVTLGDAGTAIDLARHIDLRAVTVTERKASLLIDVARAFFQWQVRAGPRRAPRRPSHRAAGGRRPPIRRHPGPRPGHHGPGEHPPGRGTVRQPDRRPEVTPGSHVLTIVACGAGPAAAIGTCVKLVQDRSWTVQVIATPAALDFFDAAAIADQTGSPVRSQYARPGAPRSLIPDAILVAPATYNTINKWAHGISDTYALGVLAETTGLGVPAIVLPSSTPPWPAAPRSAAASNPCAPKASRSSSAPAASSPTRPAPAAT